MRDAYPPTHRRRRRRRRRRREPPATTRRAMKADDDGAWLNLTPTFYHQCTHYLTSIKVYPTARRHERYLFFDPYIALPRRAIRHGTRTEDLYHTRDADNIAYTGENGSHYVKDCFSREVGARLPRHARRIVCVNPPRRDVDHALVARD